MPNWSEVLQEIQGTRIDNPLDITRRKYLSTMNKYTGRNVIACYSGFLQKPRGDVTIDDNDKNDVLLDKVKDSIDENEEIITTQAFSNFIKENPERLKILKKYYIDNPSVMNKLKQI